MGITFQIKECKYLNKIYKNFDTYQERGLFGSMGIQYQEYNISEEPNINII